MGLVNARFFVGDDEPLAKYALPDSLVSHLESLALVDRGSVPATANTSGDVVQWVTLRLLRSHDRC